MAYDMKGLLIFVLLSCIGDTKSADLDVTTLASIIKFLDNNYYVGQYAAAINVPEDQCGENFIPSENNFLTKDKGNDVKNIIKSDKYPVYRGTELIAAGVQRVPHTAHSEFLLLDPAHNSPLTYLLKKGSNKCVIFYTFNSPCMKTCLKGDYNIIPGVDELKAYEGIKAFVYQDIWINDQGKENEKKLRKKLQLIADRVPLYRCRNNCILCGEPGWTGINQNCLIN